MKSFIFLSLLAFSSAVADTNTSFTDSIDKASKSQRSDVGLARLWGMDAKEWGEYKSIMQGPRGTWSPNLDPITVLGIHAETDAEREKWAVRLVTIERDRVEKELAFERAYQRAQKRLYGNIPLYKSTGKTTIQGDKKKIYNVWLKVDCEECKKQVSKLIKDGHQLNLYFADKSKAAVQLWAVEIGISLRDVKNGAITLNLNKKAVSGDLPIVKEVQ